MYCHTVGVPEPEFPAFSSLAYCYEDSVEGFTIWQLLISQMPLTGQILHVASTYVIPTNVHNVNLLDPLILMICTRFQKETCGLLIAHTPQAEQNYM